MQYKSLRTHWNFPIILNSNAQNDVLFDKMQ